MSNSTPTSREEKHKGMVDDYVHAEDCIVYTEVNIPGPGADLASFHAQYDMGCDCAMGNCADDACRCVSRHGCNYTSDGKLVDSKTIGPVIECNSLCMCCRFDSVAETRTTQEECVENGMPNQGDAPNLGHCRNRLVQFGPIGDLEIFATSCNKGYGLRSSKPIAKGTFVCEYAGEVIGLEEARKRTEHNASNMNYIFVLNEHIGDTKIIKTYVDPEGIGNIGRYINHSCQPNCVIVPVRVDNPVPRLAIFTSRDIDVGEEITFDYGGGEAPHSAGKISAAQKPCRCGSANCRLYLPFDEELL